jgi:hypothetical protein
VDDSHQIHLSCDDDEIGAYELPEEDGMGLHLLPEDETSDAECED